MTMDQAVILGGVEGLTEHLPVSSTGHLLLAEQLMGIGDSASLTGAAQENAKEAADAYTICIQAGAILAVLLLCKRSQDTPSAAFIPFRGSAACSYTGV